MAPPVPLPFFCDLCRKGYARISELEVHETSYDHHHRKRAADLRAANRDGSRRDREQANKDGVMRVLGLEDEPKSRSAGAKGKRGFKAAFGSAPKQEEEDPEVCERRARKQELQRTAAISKLYGSRTSHDPVRTSSIDSTAASADARRASFDAKQEMVIPCRRNSASTLKDHMPTSSNRTSLPPPSPPAPIDSRTAALGAEITNLRAAR